MTDDIELIDAALQLLTEENSERLLARTYECFFSVCPTAESLWEKDDPVSREKMFNGVILAVMDNLMRPQMGENNLISDVRDHEGYGVKQEMYGLFFESLVAAFKETLGDSFTLAMEGAWKRQFKNIEETVCHHVAQ